MADTRTDTPKLPRELHALAALEGACKPTRGKLQLPPLRRLKPVPGFLGDVHIPVWEWQRPTPKDADTVELDVTAAWPSAASSVRVAHGQLQRHPYREFDKSPGYWQVDLRGVHWGHGADLMSPLGTGAHRDRPWLATPTVALLVELAAAGHWDDVTILDSWTSEQPVALTKWSNWIRDTRVNLRQAGEAETLARFKVSYAQAVAMMGTGEGTDYFRPDWNHAIRAQSAATLWRKLWHCVLTGHGPVWAGDTDAVEFLADDLTALLDMPSPPIRIDSTGDTLGTLKVTR